jgi:hypothetical protein
MQWYARRKEIRDVPLAYKIVENAVIDLLTVHKNTPEEAQRINNTTNPAAESEPDYTLQLPVFQKHHTIRRREPSADKTDRPQRIKKRTARYNSFAAAFKSIIQEQTSSVMTEPETDNSAALLEQEARILWDYNVETMGDPAGLETPSGEMDLLIALQDDDAEEFVKALRLEIHALLYETATLQPISRQHGRYVENTGN